MNIPYKFNHTLPWSISNLQLVSLVWAPFFNFIIISPHKSHLPTLDSRKQTLPSRTQSGDGGLEVCGHGARPPLPVGLHRRRPRRHRRHRPEGALALRRQVSSGATFVISHSKPLVNLNLLHTAREPIGEKMTTIGSQKMPRMSALSFFPVNEFPVADEALWIENICWRTLFASASRTLTCLKHTTLIARACNC